MAPEGPGAARSRSRYMKHASSGLLGPMRLAITRSHRRTLRRSGVSRSSSWWIAEAGGVTLGHTWGAVSSPSATGLVAAATARPGVSSSSACAHARVNATRAGRLAKHRATAVCTASTGCASTAAWRSRAARTCISCPIHTAARSSSKNARWGRGFVFSCSSELSADASTAFAPLSCAVSASDAAASAAPVAWLQNSSAATATSVE